MPDSFVNRSSDGWTRSPSTLSRSMYSGQLANVNSPVTFWEAQSNPPAVPVAPLTEGDAAFFPVPPHAARSPDNPNPAAPIPAYPRNRRRDIRGCRGPRGNAGSSPSWSAIDRSPPLVTRPASDGSVGLHLPLRSGAGYPRKHRAGKGGV